jgi:hypothetical protein
VAKNLADKLLARCEEKGATELLPIISGVRVERQWRIDSGELITALYGRFIIIGHPCSRRLIWKRATTPC